MSIKVKDADGIDRYYETVGGGTAADPFKNRTIGEYADTGQLDAYYRLRVSDPFTVFESKLIADEGALFWENNTNGTGSTAHSTTDSAVTLSVSANADYAIRQTYMRFGYQPGKSQLIIATGILGSVVASTEARIGYFNTGTGSNYTANRDGLYFGRDDTGIYIAQSKSGTETKVYQSAWNKDKMDGTGLSGITADWDSTQIFQIDFEWLGVGSVRYYLNINKIPYLVHQTDNANTGQTGAYVTSPNHSIRYEIYSTGGTSSMKQICSTVISEGGQKKTGVTRSVNTGITTQSLGTGLEALIGIRLKSNYLDSIVSVVSPSLVSTGNETSRWELQLNPTYADTPSWTSAGLSSPTEYAIGSGTNIVSASGEILASDYISNDVNSFNAAINTIIRIGADLDENRDEIWLCASTVTGTGLYVGGLNLLEQTSG